MELAATGKGQDKRTMSVIQEMLHAGTFSLEDQGIHQLPPRHP